MWFKDRIADDSRFSPSYAIDDALDEYGQCFRNWWEFDAADPSKDFARDDWCEYRRLDGLAKHIAEIGATLLRRKGVGMVRLTEPTEWQSEAEKLQQNVEQLLKATHGRLSVSDWLKLDQALNPAAPNDPRTKFNVFRNCLQLATENIFPYRLERLASRLHKLVDYLVQHSNERTAAYLSRVAKCYVLDMPTEFAVMTRRCWILH